eukprot:1157445-Pelagomonas_calceolata.AAC.2
MGCSKSCWHDDAAWVVREQEETVHWHVMRKLSAPDSGKRLNVKVTISLGLKSCVRAFLQTSSMEVFVCQHLFPTHRSVHAN